MHSLRAAFSTAGSLFTKTPINLYPNTGNEVWIQKAVEVASKLFGNKHLTKMLAEPATREHRSALSNLVHLQNADATPTGTFPVVNQNGETQVIPCYGRFRFNDSSQVVSHASSLISPQAYMKANEDATIAPKNSKVPDAFSTRIHLRDLLKDACLLHEATDFTFKIPRETLAVYDAGPSQTACAIISEDLKPMDFHEMRGYLHFLPAGTVKAYGWAVAHFIAYTAMMNPSIKTLSIDPSAERTILVTQHNHPGQVIVLSEEDDLTELGMFGIKRALFIAKQQELPFAYSEGIIEACRKMDLL